jgi:hypothetical protein
MQITQRARLRAARLALVLAASAGVLAATAPAAGASTDAPAARAAANATSPFPPNTFRVKRNCGFIGHAVGNVEAAHCGRAPVPGQLLHARVNYRPDLQYLGGVRPRFGRLARRGLPD